MTLVEFIKQLAQAPQSIAFSQSIGVIEAHYQFTPCQFFVGPLNNAAGSNQGSCKIFSFAKLHQLTQAQTLACFGDYYRQDVLEHPDADDHQNIRHFMKYFPLQGWDTVIFSAQTLEEIHRQ